MAERTWQWGSCWEGWKKEINADIMVRTCSLPLWVSQSWPHKCQVTVRVTLSYTYRCVVTYLQIQLSSQIFSGWKLEGISPNPWENGKLDFYQGLCSCWLFKMAPEEREAAPLRGEWNSGYSWGLVTELGNYVLRYTGHSNPFYLDTSECCCRQQRSSEAGLAVAGNATWSKHKCKGFRHQFVPGISSH